MTYDHMFWLGIAIITSFTVIMVAIVIFGDKKENDKEEEKDT